MENRILVVADDLLGKEGEAAVKFSELLLCEYPARPIQFTLLPPVACPLDTLLSRVSQDIIGKQAGRIVLGLGLWDLRRRGDAPAVFASYQALVRELISKTLAVVYLVTIPPAAFPGDVAVVNDLNRRIATLADGDRVHVLDFASHLDEFSRLQSARGKFARNLYNEKHEATSIGQMLLGLFLQKHLFQPMKEIL